MILSELRKDVVLSYIILEKQMLHKENESWKFCNQSPNNFCLNKIGIIYALPRTKLKELILLISLLPNNF